MASQHTISKKALREYIHPHKGYDPNLDIPVRILDPSPISEILEREIDFCDKREFGIPDPVLIFVGPTLKLHIYIFGSLFDIDSLCMQIFGSLKPSYDWYSSLTPELRDECIFGSPQPPPLYAPLEYLYSYFIPMLNCPSIRHELITLARQFKALSDPGAKSVIRGIRADYNE